MGNLFNLVNFPCREEATTILLVPESMTTYWFFPDTKDIIMI